MPRKPTTVKPVRAVPSPPKPFPRYFLWPGHKNVLYVEYTSETEKITHYRSTKIKSPYGSITGAEQLLAQGDWEEVTQAQAEAQKQPSYEQEFI